jgi:hypothetical protein
VKVHFEQLRKEALAAGITCAFDLDRDTASRYNETGMWWLRLDGDRLRLAKRGRPRGLHSLSADGVLTLVAKARDDQMQSMGREVIDVLGKFGVKTADQGRPPLDA